MKYTIADSIKSELAERMAEMAHVAYSKDVQGAWYAVDTNADGVLDDVSRAQTTRQFNSWHDKAVAIPIEDCFDRDGNDFSWGEDGHFDHDGNEVPWSEDSDGGFSLAASWALDCLLETVDDTTKFGAYNAAEYKEIFG